MKTSEPVKTEANDCQRQRGLAPVSLLGARPPVYINGKYNPAYGRWYRKANPESYRKQHDKDYVKRSRTEYDENQKVRRDECKCVFCGTVFYKDDAILRGYKFLKCAQGQRIICGECA